MSPILTRRFIAPMTCVLFTMCPMTFCCAAGGTHHSPEWHAAVRQRVRGRGRRAAHGRPGAPIWFCICMTTEFICALDVCSRDTALRERTISFASSLAVDMSPLLAACLIDCFTFVSSFFISGVGRGEVSQAAAARLGGSLARSSLVICRSSFLSSPRICFFHSLTCSFGSGALLLRRGCVHDDALLGGRCTRGDSSPAKHDDRRNSALLWPRPQTTRCKFQMLLVGVFWEATWQSHYQLPAALLLYNNGSKLTPGRRAAPKWPRPTSSLKPTPFRSSRSTCACGPTCRTSTS